MPNNRIFVCIVSCFEKNECTDAPRVSRLENHRKVFVVVVVFSHIFPSRLTADGGCSRMRLKCKLLFPLRCPRGTQCMAKVPLFLEPRQPCGSEGSVGWEGGWGLMTDTDEISDHLLRPKARVCSLRRLRPPLAPDSKPRSHVPDWPWLETFPATCVEASLCAAACIGRRPG